MYILFMFLFDIYCFWWPLSLGKFIPVARSSSSYLFICLYVPPPHLSSSRSVAQKAAYVYMYIYLSAVKFF